MIVPAIQTMAGNLTLPFAQGASTLTITLQDSDDATEAQIHPYDFSDYRARFGPLPDTQPNPSYVLATRQDIAVQTQVTVNYVGRSKKDTKGSVHLTVPAGTVAGTSFVAWLQADDTSASNVLADPDIQLSTLRMSPAAPDGKAANWWSLTALLGNMARLLWVMSCEKDVIRRQMEIVQTQRSLRKAVKFSLDLLGRDLGVPRFPPRPYSFDEYTIALYHLDQFYDNSLFGNQLFGQQRFSNQSSGTRDIVVHDSMKDYGLPGHPGRGTGLASATGRYDKALAFRPNAVISIPDNTQAFDLPDHQSFTLECLFKPDPYPPGKEVMDGEVLAKFDGVKGWSLSVGTFKRGIDRNVRLLLSDGTTSPVELYADQQLPTTGFTHIAGVIDRQARSAYLYINGTAIKTQSIAKLGALTNTEVVRIGSRTAASSAYQGVIDEVRFSRVARSAFNPVLGEADEAYRQRLTLFARWTLPTLPNLMHILNKSVGRIQGVAGPDPIVLTETDIVTVTGTLPLTVLPLPREAPATTPTPGPVSLLIRQADRTQRADGFTLHVGDRVQLATQPVPGSQQTTAWMIINCGTGQAKFDKTNSPTVSLTATKPGPLYIKVELTSGQNILADTATLRILPRPADMGIRATIGDDGTLGISQDVAGQPDPLFRPAYLITHNDARATYGDKLDNRRMQISVAQLLDKLLASIATKGSARQLEIVQAYTPDADNSSVAQRLFKVGRALRLYLPGETGDSLAVMAHSVGFTYVERQQGEHVLVLQRPGELITIKGPKEVKEGESISLSLSPTATPTAIAASTKAIYTANSGTDTISVIDPATGMVRTAVKVGWGPGALVLSPDGKRLYSADTLGNTITVLDIDAKGDIQVHAPPQMPVGNKPVALAHHPSTQNLYVVCQGDNTLLNIDTNTLRITNTLSVGTNPLGLALTPDGKEVWVTLNGDKQLAIVGTSPFQSVSSITLAQAPRKIAIAPNGQRAYATLPDGVVVLDAPGRKVKTTTPLESSPGAIAVAPDNSGIYVTSEQSERVYLLQPDGTAGGTVSIGQKSDDVVVLRSTPIYVYVVSSRNSMVTTVNAQKKVAVNAWPLGTGLGESPVWILGLGSKRASLSNVTTPYISLKGEHAGPVWLKGVYVLPGNTAAYTFDIRLRDETNSPIIRKEQYDLIMNILDVFHPIGVEVTTHAIRKYVIELRKEQLIDDTFPNFRMPASLLD